MQRRNDATVQLPWIRHALLALAAAALAVPLALVSPAPSHAALISGCTLTVTRPTTDGSWAYGTAQIACTGGNAYADFVNTRIRRQTTVGWENGAWYYANPIPAQYSISRSASFNCNGSGTRTYRTHGYAGDIYGGTANNYGTTGVSLTC